MSGGSAAARFCLGAVPLGLLTALPLWLWFPAGTAPWRWALWGWSIMTLTAVGGGAWLAARVGTRGSGFLLALAASMLTRLCASAAGAAAVMLWAREAAGAYLAGLAAGFVPMQVYEIAWFHRRGRSAAQTDAAPRS